MQLGLFSVLWQHKILGYPDAQIYMCVWERENMWAVLLLPVSIWCRLLLLRLRSLRSLDSTKCFGLRCFILLLDRSILTMSDGRSGGMLIKSADRKSSETLGLQLSWYLKDKSFYYHQCTQKKICEQRVWTFPALQLRQKCVRIFMASRWFAGCVQLFTFSRWSQRGHHVWQHFTYLPEGSLFCLHWKHHSHTLILVFEVTNALNSQSVLRIAISITEPLWSFELKSHTGGRFYKCSSCCDGGGEIKIWRCHYKTTENKRLKPVCSALTMNRCRFLWSQFTFWRFWIKAFTD